MTNRIPLALCALALCALTACQTTKAKPDILTLPQPAVDAQVKAFLLDPNPGFVLRGRLDAWSELAPTLELLAQSVPDDRLGDLLDELGSGGPVAAFEGLVGDQLPADAPDLALVDRSGTGWVHVSVTASEQTWGLLDLGVGLMSPHEPLAFWTVEALIPSTDPAKLAAQFDVGDLQAEAKGSYVHVWRSIPIQSFGGDTGTPPEVFEQQLRPWRMTPALARFLSDDAPGALYVRARDTRLLAASGGVTEMMEAIRFASAEYKQRLMARGLAVSLLAISLTPRSVAEFEDHAILLGGDAEAEGAFVDVVSTRTAFGREVQAAGASASTSLPTISNETMPPDRAILDASYSFHAAAVDDLYAPTAEALFGAGKTAGMRVLQRTARDLSQVGPLGALSILATSPTFIAGAFSALADPRLIGDARPLAARVRVAQASTGAFPFGAAAAVAFTGDTSVVRARIDEFKRDVQPRILELLSIELTSAEGGDVLTVAFNLTGDAFGPAAPVPVAQGQLRFDASPLGNMSSEARMVGAIGSIHVQALPGVSASFARISISKQPLPRATNPSYFFDAAPNPDPCVDLIAMEATRTIDVMATVVPEARFQVFGDYEAAVDACADKIESPYWAIARSRGDTFPYFFANDYDGALAAYAKACAEVGDEAACAARAHLERVGPPAPPMEGPEAVMPIPDN